MGSIDPCNGAMLNQSSEGHDYLLRRQRLGRNFIRDIAITNNGDFVMFLKDYC